MTVLPVLHYSGVWPNPLAYLIPTQGPLLLLGEAFDQIAWRRGRSLYAVAYPIAVPAGLCWAAKAMFVRYVIARSGVHVMAVSAAIDPKAWPLSAATIFAAPTVIHCC